MTVLVIDDESLEMLQRLQECAECVEPYSFDVVEAIFDVHRQINQMRQAPNHSFVKHILPWGPRQGARVITYENENQVREEFRASIVKTKKIVNLFYN